MINLNYTPKDDLGEGFLDEIHKAEFDSFDEFYCYLLAEYCPEDECVYTLCLGDDIDGFIFIDHEISNIFQILDMMYKKFLKWNPETYKNVFIFVCDTYEEAYNLAKDMKEPSGLAYDWQKEDSERQPATKHVINLGLSNRN